jgi:hypothetical protein
MFVLVVGLIVLFVGAVCASAADTPPAAKTGAITAGIGLMLLLVATGMILAK